LAAYLTERLRDIPGLKTPRVMPDRRHVFHLYPLEIDAVHFGVSKDDFIYAMLHEHGIKFGTHYIPLHYSTAFKKRGFTRGQFPAAEGVAERLVTLPLHPRLTFEALDYMIGCIRGLGQRR